MTLRIWQVDAFADKLFEGNPAAVVPLEAWADDRRMQQIAAENNLSETAFLVKKAAGKYDLRWFTPATEVDLCGHATLASAWVIFHRLEKNLDEVRFQTRSGELIVRRGEGDYLAMSLPSASCRPLAPPDGFARDLASALSASPPQELHFADKGGAGAGTLVAVWPHAQAIGALRPEGNLGNLLLSVGAHSLIATAPGFDDYDFVSRFFAPAKGVAEDPVTGSAHCVLTPFWAGRLGKSRLKARQLSARGGTVLCTDDGARSLLEGKCALYLTGEIQI